jgi:hypothetical protein
LELGNPNRGNCRGNEPSQSQKLGLIHLPVIENPDQT